MRWGLRLTQWAFKCFNGLDSTSHATGGGGRFSCQTSCTFTTLHKHIWINYEPNSGDEYTHTSQKTMTRVKCAGQKITLIFFFK